MQFTVLFNAGNGISFGVTGEGPIQCLQEFADRYGPEFLALFEDAENELAMVLKTITLDKESVQLPTDVHGGDGETADDEAGSEEDHAVSAPEPRTEIPEHTCAVCGREITADTASATKLTVGTPRCWDCVAD